jgi:hypothetical protein
VAHVQPTWLTSCCVWPDPHGRTISGVAHAAAKADAARRFEVAAGQLDVVCAGSWAMRICRAVAWCLSIDDRLLLLLVLLSLLLLLPLLPLV